MASTSALWSVVQTAVRLERPQVSVWTATRNALGVALPLALGFATGQRLTGLAIAIGALIVSFSDQPGPYPVRVRRMLLASLAGALSAFLGSSTASTGWLSIVLTMVWGFWGGLLVALGPVLAQVGLASIILFLVYAGHPLPLDQAAITGALICVGGAFQTILVVAQWPFRPYGPERDALADVFGALAAYARAPLGGDLAPPLTAETTAAQTMLSEIGRGSGFGEALRIVLDNAVRVRLVLIALDDTWRRLGCDTETTLGALVSQARSTAAVILTALDETLRSGSVSSTPVEQLQRLEDAARAARPLVVNPTQDEALLLVEALVVRLRAAIESTCPLLSVTERAWRSGVSLLPHAFDFGDSVSVLRANLTFRSASFRHAIRLSVCLGIAEALALALNSSHGYWLPLTVAVVLRPDFSATFARGILRVGGTLLGLIIATVVVRFIVGNVAAEVAFVAVLVFAIRRLAAQNYGLSVIGITALVVIFFSLLGANPEQTIIDRGLNTLLGGVLALALYAVWPTWERSQTPAILADLLDAYREYFDEVMTGYLSPAGCDVGRLGSLRLAARLARTNAEASIERLRGEPARSEAEFDRVVAFLAASNRFVRAAIALEAQMHAAWMLPIARFLRTFVADVDSTLCLLAHSLRFPAQPMTKLPNLHDDLLALKNELITERGRADVAPDSIVRHAAFLAEAERIVDSLDALAQIIRRRERPIATNGGQIASENAA